MTWSLPRSRTILAVLAISVILAIGAALPAWPGAAVGASVAGSPASAPREGSPAGLWVSENQFGVIASGTLSVSLEGRRGRAWISGRTADFEVRGDSVAFVLGDGSGSFRGRIDPDRHAIGGFWIRRGIVEGVTNVSGDRGGPFDQAFATPIRLVAVAAGHYRGVVAPPEARFTLYLYIWADSTGSWRAALRNPEFNSNGGAWWYHLSVAGDSLHLVARFPDPHDPELHLEATWDRTRSRIRMPWEGFVAPVTFEPCSAARAAGFWPRVTRGRPCPYRAPSAIDDGWRTARAASVGIDESALARFTRAIADTNPAGSRPPLVHSCLIERHGRLVYEEYFFGFDRDRTHDMRSASKTFASVLVGTAMREGLPIAPESTVFSMMAGRGRFANDDPRKARITVGHLLTHTSGLACDDNDDDSPGNEDTMQRQTGAGWWTYVLDLPMAFEPGTHYAYCSGGMNLVGGALEVATRRWIPEYFDSTVARPLGFATYHYNLMPDGEGYLGGGVQLRPRDLLKLGRVYLDGGVWHGRRIVDSTWVRRSTRLQTGGTLGTDGYAWHLNVLKCGDREYREFEANGNGGQMLIVLPELDMSVVFTAGDYQAASVWTRFRSELVPQRIIAAIRDR
ncbi:MAG: serine hydrolase domain-containing protein [Candidatus Eisenbacteria bacterium]